MCVCACVRVCLSRSSPGPHGAVAARRTLAVERNKNARRASPPPAGQLANPNLKKHDACARAALVRRDAQVPLPPPRRALRRARRRARAVRPAARRRRRGGGRRRADGARRVQRQGACVVIITVMKHDATTRRHDANNGPRAATPAPYSQARDANANAPSRVSSSSFFSSRFQSCLGGARASSSSSSSRRPSSTVVNDRSDAALPCAAPRPVPLPPSLTARSRLPRRPPVPCPAAAVATAAPRPRRGPTAGGARERPRLLPRPGGRRDPRGPPLRAAAPRGARRAGFRFVVPRPSSARRHDSGVTGDTRAAGVKPACARSARRSASRTRRARPSTATRRAPTSTRSSRTSARRSTSSTARRTARPAAVMRSCSERARGRPKTRARGCGGDGRAGSRRTTLSRARAMAATTARGGALLRQRGRCPPSPPRARLLSGVRSWFPDLPLPSLALLLPAPLAPFCADAPRCTRRVMFSPHTGGVR